MLILNNRTLEEEALTTSPKCEIRSRADGNTIKVAWHYPGGGGYSATTTRADTT